MAFAFGGLGSQLDVLQLALNGALAAAHQTPELGKREILIGMGTVAPKKKMIKKLDSEGKISWTSVEEIDQVEVKEKVQQARMLSSGVMVYEEVEVTVKKDKLRTTSEYIRIPKGNDFAEISAAQGTPLSVALLASLKSNAPSYALSEATEVFWGESTAPGEITVYGEDKGDIYVAPIIALLEETGIDYAFKNSTETVNKEAYEKINPTKVGPALKHSIPSKEDPVNGPKTDVFVWGSSAILRYLGVTFKLEYWYSSDLKERADADLALDFYSNSFLPPVLQAIESEKTVVDKFKDDFKPAIQNLLDRGTGGIIGNTGICLADLTFLIALTALRTKVPNNEIAKDAKIQSYTDSILSYLPKQSEYLDAVVKKYKKP